jgi:hypothetical protein
VLKMGQDQFNQRITQVQEASQNQQNNWNKRLFSNQIIIT